MEPNDNEWLFDSCLGFHLVEQSLIRIAAVMTPQHRHSFTESIGVLLEELKLSIQWNRPSILFAVCNSRSGQIKAENDLKNKLQRLGIRVIKVEVSGHSPFVSHQIVNLSNEDKIVFFVSNIDWGGGPDGKDEYRNLNMDREALVENQIKAVFWLTRSEALNLPIHAPDFWAFRHEVVEFSASRTGERIKLSSGILIWHGPNTHDTPQQAKERIEAYQREIMELPTDNEALSSRIELLYSIGYIDYWILGNAMEALKLLQSGIDLVIQPELSLLRTWLLNGMAIIYYEQGEYKKAAGIYEDLIVDNPKDFILRLNLSVTLCALGKFSIALSKCKKAVKLNTTDARIWNRLGYICMSAGKLDEAVSNFKKAIELAPASSAFYESLAICYYTLGLIEESIGQIRLAYKYAEGQTIFIRVYEETIHGKPEKSLDVLKAALASSQISIADIRHDFNTQILLDGSLAPVYSE